MGHLRVPMFTEMIEELKHLRVSFDFRRNQQISSKVFEKYKSTHGFDLATVIDTVSLVLNLKDTTGREKAMERFEALFKLSKNAHIRVYIECGGKTQPPVARSFHHLLCNFAPVVGQMKQFGFEVTVIMNPTYTLSNIKNSSESEFSIIRAQLFPYLFSVKSGELSVVDMEIQLNRISPKESSLIINFANYSRIISPIMTTTGISGAMSDHECR